MNAPTEVTAARIESAFSQTGDSFRFANFCNAVLVTETVGTMPSLPILSEKPGADGGFDGEWYFGDAAKECSNSFVELGWNVFQYKARSSSGGGRKKAVSGLKCSLRGALKDLAARLKVAKSPARYVLFTNLQLGLKTKSTTERGAELSTERAEIEAAILEGSDLPAIVQIIDAAQLAAIVNKHPALRLTYFEPTIGRSWSEEWDKEKAAKGDKVFIPVVGREKEIEQLQAWIADQAVKVIVISGPSGMGKTRSALEATRPDHLRTTFVENVDELERCGTQSLDTSDQPRLIIVEDPTENQANRLAKQAVSTNGVKFIFTFPSEAKAPQLKLTEHEAVKQMKLEPLSRDRSQKLLESAGAILDNPARDWVVQQAGGIPAILLSVAELGPNLRDKSGDLRRRLTEEYRRRISKELGNEAVCILRILSALHWVAVSGENTELPALIGSIGQGLTASGVMNYLNPLEKLGYLRRRGDYVSVVPPLFAAALAEELLASVPRGVCDLFDRLGDPSRKRLLERAVTTDLSDQATLWSHVFESALWTTELLIANLDLLDFLARAIPLRTARFFTSHIENIADVLGIKQQDWKKTTLLSILRELAYNQESSHVGVQLLEAMALREEWLKEPQSATELFCECFVHWFYEFPLSFQDREKWILNMLKSSDTCERQLAAHAIVMVTAPPHGLSGYSGNARRLGQRPATRLWSEVYEYLEHFLDLRFELTQDGNPGISEYAQDHFVRCFRELRLPPARKVGALQKFMDWRQTGRISPDEWELRQVLHWIEKDYTDASKKPDQIQHANKWAPVLERLALMRRQLDEGPFELRLKIALGPSFEHEWEEVGGKRFYAFEKRCGSLAAEAVEKPELMNESAWRLLSDPGSQQAYSFILSLGELDRSAAFLPHFESEANDQDGSHNLALYLAGLQRHDPTLIDRILDDLIATSEFPKALLLRPIVHTGPTPGNRRRLLRMISEGAVEPLAVADMFTSGRWLGDLPPSEVRTILEFIETGPSGWPKYMMHVISCYVYHGKPLPTELFPVAERALQAVEEVDDKLTWDCGRVAISIARTDIDKGFEILRKHIAAFKAAEPLEGDIGKGWNMFRSLRSNDLWMFLRTQAPEKAYRELLLVEGTNSENELDLPLDLERHQHLLLKIGAECESDAVLLSRLVSGSHVGFFLFAYKLMDLYPTQGNIASNLGLAAVYGVGDGCGDWDYSQALAKVEAELENATTPKRLASWLEDLKRRIKMASRSNRVRDLGDSHLGWD